MTTARSLKTLGKVRRRQLDQARAALAAASLAFTQFEATRKAWRHDAEAEATAANETAPLLLGIWLEAARRREWQGAARAAALRAAVVDAERRYRTARLAEAQVQELERQAGRRARDARLDREQRQLDDVRRRIRFDEG